MLNGIFSGLISNIPQMLLMLPAIFISLSVHEAAHGYAAYKLGDPTARNLGRLTLNPMKHINPIGFICMVLFGVGWANPVPVNTRHFKKPRRDMAITAAAGPLSNLCLAVIFTLLLRLVMIPLQNMAEGNYMLFDSSYYLAEEIATNTTFILLSVLAIIFYLGITLNLSLMIFNLIPLPPLDGSRIAYIFLPTNVYFGIMKYEKYIMIGFLALLYLGILTLPLNFITSWIETGLFKLTAMPDDLIWVVISNLFSRFTI